MFEGEVGSISTRLQGGHPASLSLSLCLNESQCPFVPFVSLIMSVFDKGFKALRSLVVAGPGDWSSCLMNTATMYKVQSTHLHLFVFLHLRPGTMEL